MARAILISLSLFFDLSWCLFINAPNASSFTYLFILFFIITTCPRCSSRQIFTFSPTQLSVKLFIILHFYRCNVSLLPTVSYSTCTTLMSAFIHGLFIFVCFLHTTLFLVFYYIYSFFYRYSPVLAAAPDNLIQRFSYPFYEYLNILSSFITP